MVGEACNTATLQSGGAFSEFSKCVTNWLCLAVAAEWSETLIPTLVVLAPPPTLFKPLAFVTGLKPELLD